MRTPLSELTWVIWRYDWPFLPGKHTFTVRCYDGNGTLQIAAPSPPEPDGATGAVWSVRNVVERELAILAVVEGPKTREVEIKDLGSA
jgi:hypothetical protein